MTDLTPEERQLVEELLASQDDEQSLQRRLDMVPLILGAIVFVACALFTLRNLNDYTAQWVMLPGTGVSLALFALYIAGLYRRRSRQRYAAIIRKLMWASWRRDGPRGRVVRTDT